MLNFILNAIFWTLALYGVSELVNKIIHMHDKSEIDNMYVIVAVKDGEKNIEYLIRSTLADLLCENKKIIVVDLNSTDGTEEILNKMEKDNENIKVMKWNECKEILDQISITNN